MLMTLPHCMLLAGQSQGGVRIAGTLAGLPPASTGGWHVHVGRSCAAAEAVGAHYFDGLLADPWTVANGGPVYYTDAHGVATVDYNISDFSLHGTRPIGGRAIVVHDPTSTRSGCGVASAASTAAAATPAIAPTTSASLTARATLAPYPGQLNELGGTILLEVAEGSASLYVRGLISGLEPAAEGGWHVHTGFTCDAATLVGGHFFPTGGTDAWLQTRWASDADGVAELREVVPGYGLTRDGALRGLGGPTAVLGRTVVVHDASGARVACGVIEPAHGLPVRSPERYPGYRLR